MIPLRDVNPTRRRPVVTVVLLAVNLAAFVYELTLGPELGSFLQQAGFVPSRALGGQEGVGEAGFSILTSMFLHGGFAHFLGNMLFLWVFGDNIEDRLGHLRFVVFYLACGYAAAFAHAAANAESALPAIGASGAISGVLGAYLLLHPKAKVVTLVFLGFLITTIQVPAYVYLPLWFLLQLGSGIAEIATTGTSAGEVGGVAWFAHIGGFVAGPVMLFLLGGGRRRDGDGGDPRDRRGPRRNADPSRAPREDRHEPQRLPAPGRYRR